MLNGKHVSAPLKNIAVVKNSYEMYERLDELDSYSVDDLLAIHCIMKRGLVEESEEFRTRPLGVVESEGHILHFGTLPEYVLDLVMELIYPFVDGTECVGRLWHTLLLSKWNSAFVWLPSIVYER